MARLCQPRTVEHGPATGGRVVVAEKVMVRVEPEDGLSRRELLRRAAIVGGAVLWIAPAIQTLAPPAYADVSPGISTCCQCQKVSGTGGPAFQCYANNPTANTPTSCNTKCTTFHPGGSNYVMQDFHQDFPAGSGKSFSCVPAAPSGTKCSPVPH